MFEDPIVSLFTTSIDKSERAMNQFVDRVSSAYGRNPDNSTAYPAIERQAAIGSYGIDGSVEPLVSGRDLNYKLQALDLVPGLNIQALRPNTYMYAQSIYGGMGIESPATQTFGGDMAGGSSFNVAPMSSRAANNPMTTAVSLGGGATNNLIGASGLEGSLMRLQQTLSSDYGIQIQINRINALDGSSSSPTQLSVTVPNIEIGYDNTPLSQSGDRDLLRTSSKTFQFTTTEMGGVIEMQTNRYIGGSLLNTVDRGTIRQSSFETTAGFVGTYVLQQQIILDQATSLAFKQFLTNQQTLNPTQSYFELDKFLGRAVGQDLPFSQYVKSISNTATAKDFLDLQNVLGQKLGIGLGTERFSQVSANELATIQSSAIARILQPLGQNPDKSSVSDRVIKNLARELLNPQTVTNAENKTIRVDAFTQLKQQILASSGAGNSILQDRIRAMLNQGLSTGRKSLLDQLRSPFLQPHESNYSGAQQMGKLAYYAEDRSLLTASDGRSKIMQLPGVYSHGSGGIPTGEIFAPVSSTSSRNKIYDSQYHDSQLELTGKDTASFFDINTLFTGSRQLNTTTLADLASSLGDYQDKDKWLTQLQQELNITNAQSQILLTPYKRAEQIPQRLKNLTGTRPAIEYSLDFYNDILAQGDLSKYSARDANGAVTHLDRALTVSANLNTVMPKIQYEKAREMSQTSPDLTADLRRIEANPSAEVRGFVTTERLKRVFISTGANQGSDFMHLNADYKSYSGYEQYTKIEVQSIQSYDAAGGKLYVQNIGADLQRSMLQQAFEPGRYIYYNDTKLTHAGLNTKLNTAYNQILADYAGKLPDAITPVERASMLASGDLRSLVSSGLKQRFNYIRSVQFDSESQSLNFTLKAGLYGRDGDNLNNYGLFDRDSSQLVMGLTPQVDQDGQFSLAKQMTVKISGTLRKDQQGVAVTNDMLQFSKVDGRLFAHANYTILFEGPVRSGIENVKGPGRVDTPELFNYYDKQMEGVDYTSSERTLTNNPTYAVMSSASLKGYSYESGLDVLSTNKSTDLFIQRLSKSGTTTTALFATFFASDLSDLLPSSASAADRQQLNTLSRDLQAAIKTSLTNSSEYDIHLQRSIDSLGNAYDPNRPSNIAKVKSNQTLTKNANLFINNAGLFDLLDRDASGMGLGVDAPLAQLQQTLLRSLTTGDDRFLIRAVELFANATKESFEERNYRTYNQSDPKVRAASVVSQILGSTYQVLDYGRARSGNDPLTKAIFELNLVDPRTGRLNTETIFGEHHAGAIDLLTRAKVAVPRAETLTKMRGEYQDAVSQGRKYAPERSRHRAEYHQFAAEVLNLYASSQTAIPVAVSLVISPSKILQAAGSKDSANLEYHYSIAMSKNQIDKMRGYVSNPNELTETAAAYRLLVNLTQSKSLESLKFISPFKGSEAIENYRTAVGSLEYAGSLANDLDYFGADRNQTLFAEYARAAVNNDTTEMSRIVTGMKTLDATARYYTGSDENQIRQRAIALSTATDTRRGVLKEPGQSNQTRSAGKFVFFDIETSGLVDERYTAGDARRYPTQSINELTFIFGEQENARTVSWSSKSSGEFKSRAEALAEVSRLLDGEFKDAALVGHNIRAFDIPTLSPLLGRTTLYGREVYDTLVDVDRIRVKAELATSKFSQTVAYKQVVRNQLIAMGDDPMARQALESGEYGTYAAHEALADTQANIELFKFLREKNLFRQEQTQLDVKALGRGQMFDRGSITYFDAAPGSNSKLYKTAREQATLVYREAGRSHLGYHLSANRDEYTQRFQSAGVAAGLDGALVAQYTEQLLFKSMNQAGRLALGKGVQPTDLNVRVHFDTYARASDLKVERAIETSLLSSDASYIDNIQRQSLEYRELEVNRQLQGDTAGAARARKLAMTLHETRVLVMPHLDIQPNSNGNFDVSLVAANPEKDGTRRALLGNSLIYLGSDILSQLPKEFGEFVPQIIRHRRDIDRVMPEYMQIIEGIQEGRTQLTPRQREVVADLERFSAQNSELIYGALGETLKQRAFGEKTKMRGVSGTTVASYLLHADEVGLGSRFSNALGQNSLKRLAKLQGFEHGADEVLVLRAGGPAGASQLDQSYRVTSMQQLSDRADTMGTYTKLDPKGNHTTSIIPIFGRFATQGGDFDGDSYSIVSRYEQEFSSLVDMLEKQRELKSTAFTYGKAINSDRETYIKNFADRKYDSLLANEYSGNLKGKSTAQLEAEVINLTSQARVAELKLQAQAAANASYEKGLAENRFGTIPAAEVQFLQTQLQEVNTQQEVLAAEIKAKKLAVAELLTKTGDIAERSVASVRRSVAAYTGLPASYLSKESGMFTDAQVFNAIEQHRGVTPGLEDLERAVVQAGDLENKVSRSGDFNLRLNQTLAQIHDDYIRPSAEIQSYLEGHQELRAANPKLSVSLFDKQGMMGLRGQFAAEYLAGVGATVEGQIAAVPDTDVRTTINRAVEAVGMPAYLGYTPTERYNKTLEFSESTNPIGQSLTTIAKIVSNAGGTSLSTEAFGALTSVITSTGTSLIGEAYNSITLLIGRTMIARSLSEALADSLPFATGIDRPADNKFLATTKATFERTLASGQGWQGNPNAAKLDEARDLLTQVFDDPAPLATAAYSRAQNLTGLLGNVQQSIRDSLKVKIDGGLLQSVMREPVVGTNTIYQILTSSTSADEDRLPALRKFISEDAGAAIFNLPGERTYADRYKVTAFGALFLLKDFLSLENHSQAEKMLGLNSTKQHDDNELTKYAVLQERYEQLSAEAARTNNPKLAAMLATPQTFIAQSVIDLINMSVAERTVYQAMFKGDNREQHLEQMVKIRQKTMQVFGSKTVYGFTAEAINLGRQEFFGNGDTRTDYHQDIAKSLFFDSTNGTDLLKTDGARIDAAQSLGLTQVIDIESFRKNEQEFYQRATTNFINTQNQKYGLKVADLVEMQQTYQALNYLRFESVAGNTMFKNFTIASASAIEALTIASTRTQIDDPAQMAAVSYEAGSQLVAALGEVHETFTKTYGNLHFDREGTGIPQETLRAYHAAQSLSGIFNQLFSTQTTDPEVLKPITEMFALSLAGQDKDGNSGWRELSYFLGGMAQKSKTLDLLMYVPAADRNSEATEMHRSYSEAIDRDTEAGVPKNKMGTHQTQFITELGRVAAAEAAPTAVVSSPVDNATQIAKHARTSLIGAFIGPALMTMLASAQGDDNLLLHGIGLVQAVAQVSEIYTPRQMSAAALFQVDRMRNTIKENGAVVGALRAVTSEVMFEAVGRLAHQALGSHRSPVRNYLAEVGIAALGLAIAGMGGDRKFGALGVGEDGSQMQALIALPGIGIGIAESAIEEFMRSNSVESDFDTQIEYEVSIETRETGIKEAFQTGWLKNSREDEGSDERDDGTAMAYNLEDTSFS